MSLPKLIVVLGTTCLLYTSVDQVDQAIEYIRNTPQIRDVLLSGGDALLVSDERLEYIIAKLREIPHVEIVRIGSRTPVVLPQRITPELCNMLKKYHPIWLNTVSYTHLLLVMAHGEGRPAEQLPLRRQGEALAAVVQQPDAIVGLEVLDVLGHRRLGDVQLLRRPGIAAQAAYRQKGLHPKVLHALSPFSPSILHPVPGEKGEFCTGRRKCRAPNLQDYFPMMHFGIGFMPWDVLWGPAEAQRRE